MITKKQFLAIAKEALEKEDFNLLKEKEILAMPNLPRIIVSFGMDVEATRYGACIVTTSITLNKGNIFTSVDLVLDWNGFDCHDKTKDEWDQIYTLPKLLAELNKHLKYKELIHNSLKK